jgi:hypothetical protein
MKELLGMSGEDFYKEIFSTMDGRISDSGIEKVASVFDLIEDSLIINSNTVKDLGGISNAICILIKDITSKKIIPISLEIRDDSDKELLFAYVRDHTDQSSCDAVVMICEAWIAPVHENCSRDFRPSQAPDRVEAVVTSVHLNLAYTPTVITVTQVIGRETGSPLLNDPLFAIHIGGEIRGRMAGFENQLCSII